MVSLWDINAPLNQNVRYNHEEGCRVFGSGPDTKGRLFVKRTSTGFIWFCHNCGGSGFRKLRPLEIYGMSMYGNDGEDDDGLVGTIRKLRRTLKTAQREIVTLRKEKLSLKATGWVDSSGHWTRGDD